MKSNRLLLLLGCGDGLADQPRPRTIVRTLWDIPYLGLCQLAVWQRRDRERSRLRALDDHMLRDIGITRADAERECSKPFWRP